ncbi:MAG: flagellar biosynthesis protein FlhF [Deltaproteobacteria bacterium]|nr:flagellar biosynthesis protein FlhF [Deltaproteobacteria bacterium]
MSHVVQTFRAPDPASALAAVKAALGPDAVLLSTRTVQTGLLRRREVEVTAAAAAPALAEPPRPAAPPAPRPRLAPAGDEALAAEVRHLRRSVEEARRALAAVTREARAHRDLDLPPPAVELYARLLGRGVEPVLAEELVRQALELARSRPAPLDALVRDLLGERLLPCRAPWLHEGRHVIALVGPTGVGKTTTLAKIAARAVLEARRKVALLTVDTYRIGATDQLARYGEIMGVPVLVARDRNELRRAAERVREADLVLIDTAGRSSADDVARQAELVRSVPRVQLHLVVSAASGASALAAVAEQYRGLMPDRLVFSKLDESSGPGAILSAAVRVGRPVACIADGQRVPEDLHAPTGPELCELVLTGYGTHTRERE